MKIFMMAIAFLITIPVLWFGIGLMNTMIAGTGLNATTVEGVNMANYTGVTAGVNYTPLLFFALILAMLFLVLWKLVIGPKLRK